MGITAPPGIQPSPVLAGPFRPAHRRRRLIQPVEASRYLCRNSHSLTVRDRSLRHAIDGNRKRPSVRSRRSPFRPLRGTTAGRRRSTPHRSGALHHLSRDIPCAKSFSRPRNERLCAVSPRARTPAQTNCGHRLPRARESLISRAAGLLRRQRCGPVRAADAPPATQPLSAAGGRPSGLCPGNTPGNSMHRDLTLRVGIPRPGLRNVAPYANVEPGNRSPHPCAVREGNSQTSAHRN